MKSTEEIIARAIILVCLSDRCALEENIIEGRRYTRSEREKQREAIRNWLISTRYMEYATEKEGELFDKQVGAVHKNNLLQYQVQYEAVEPCLWSLGLVEQLSDYENFVLKDFLVNNRLFASLSTMEKERIRMIAVWRQHAFEWIIGNDSWDEVEVNT